jgi:hypothetical protein
VIDARSVPDERRDPQLGQAKFRWSIDQVLDS